VPDETRILNVPPPRELLLRKETEHQDAVHSLNPYVLLTEHALARAAEPDWLVDGMIARGNVIILAGQAKRAGKSWLSLHLAHCLAAGRPFLGKRTKQVCVAYANVEDGIARIGWRMGCLGVPPDLGAKLLLFHDRRCLLPLYEALPYLVDRYGLGLVIVDPLVKLERAHGIVDENSSLETDQLIDYYQTLGDSIGLSFLFIHHFAKMAERMRGSSAIEGASSGWWNLTQGKNELRLLEGTLRDGKDFSTGIKYDFRTDAEGRPSMVLTPVAAEAVRLPAKGNGAGAGNGKDGSKSNGKGTRTVRSEVELYNEAVAVVAGRNGTPIAKDDLAKLIGGRRARALEAIERAASDGKIIYIERPGNPGYVAQQTTL